MPRGSSFHPYMCYPLCTWEKNMNYILSELVLVFLQLAKDMATTATRVIRREIKDLYINIQTLQEKDMACGSGNGIM